MSFYTLFWILCAVLAGHVVVAAIGIAKALRKTKGGGSYRLVAIGETARPLGKPH